MVENFCQQLVSDLSKFDTPMKVNSSKFHAYLVHQSFPPPCYTASHVIYNITLNIHLMGVLEMQPYINRQIADEIMGSSHL